MIPDFPHIEIKYAPLKKKLLRPSIAGSLPCCLSQLYYEESLVLSNLNSKLFRFHSIHPNLHGWVIETFQFQFSAVYQQKMQFFDI